MQHLLPDQQAKVHDFLAIIHSQDQEMAIKFLTIAHYDLERAIESYFTHGPSLVEQHQQMDLGQAVPQQIMNNPPDEQLLARYQAHLRNKREAEYAQYNLISILTNGFTGLLGGISGLFSKMVPRFLRANNISPGLQFINQVNSRLAVPTNIHFQEGDFEMNMAKAQEMGRPLVVLIYSPQQMYQSSCDNLLHSDVVAALLNTEFMSLGLLSASQESDRLKDKVTSQYWPCLAIFRRNILDEDQLLDNIIITADPQSEQYFLTRLNDVLGDYTVLHEEEERVKREAEHSQGQAVHRAQFTNMADFQRQAEANIQRYHQAQLDRDRQIRQEQDQQYLQMQQQLAQQEEEQRLQAHREEQQLQEYQRELEQQELKAQRLAEHKRIMKESFVAEPSKEEKEVMLIKFCLPNGQRLQRRFRQDDKVQSLFDFVWVQDGDMFENKVDPRYNLVQTHPFLSFQEKKEECLGKVFGGSRQEVVYVQEQD